MIISVLMLFSLVQQCVTAVHGTQLLPLFSHPNSVLAGVNEAKWGVDERKPGERGDWRKKRRRGMNNKCTMLESIFKGRLEESECKLRCSHDPSARTRPALFLGHLYQTSQDGTSKNSCLSYQTYMCKLVCGSLLKCLLEMLGKCSIIS